MIRLNPKHTTVVEQVATNALAIAKRLNDPVHIMARANDLKKSTESANREVQNT